MRQANEHDRVFLIPEASYDERVENLTSMYSMLKKVISMARMTGELAMNDKGVKRSFKWLLARCDKYDVFADQILKAEAIPHRYVQSMDRADLESKKATEHFADGALKGNPDDDPEDGDGVFDDYGDVYDLGFFDDDDDSPSLAELECMADEMYALREDAVACMTDAA